MPALTFTTRANTSAKIAANAIEVRSLCLLSCQGETERLIRYLCASERERADRFHFQADYDRYVVARAALRSQLGAFLDCDPGSLSFQYTRYGKPFIANRGIEFNLSHSGDWVLLAFTRIADIGVDIERIRPMHDMRDVARENFAANEFDMWEATSEQDRTPAFYRCWTRKESFIKAIGEGLSCPLDSFQVTFGLNQPARLTSVDGNPAPATEWWMADLPGFTGYAAAVTARAANSAQVRLVVQEITGTDL